MPGSPSQSHLMLNLLRGSRGSKIIAPRYVVDSYSEKWSNTRLSFVIGSLVVEREVKRTVLAVFTIRLANGPPSVSEASNRVFAMSAMASAHPK